MRPATAEEAEELALLLALKDKRRSRRFSRLYPDETTEHEDGSVYHARELYPKHLEIMAAGAEFRERCFMAANRVGKTQGVGAYEVTCHATGRYPAWWEGYRFEEPVQIWAAGATNETTRDIVQAELFGKIGYEGNRKRFTGTGMVPDDCIGSISWKQGVQDLADVVAVRHAATGGWSYVGLKSYHQGRKAFEGTAQHVVWLDEEPPLDVYGECLIRTATTNGRVLITFTPMEGLSETVLQFMPQDQRPAA